MRVVIEARAFELRIRNAGDRDVLAIEPEDPALRPLALALVELWAVSRTKLLEAIADRTGIELGVVGFWYGDEGVTIYSDEDRVVLPSPLFEELVSIYDREAIEILEQST